MLAIRSHDQFTAAGPVRCTRTNATVDDGDCGRDYGTCGSVHAACNSSGFCVVPRGAEPGPLCETPRPTPARSRNGTAILTPFWNHVCGMPEGRIIPHTPCAVLCVVAMLPGC